LSILRAPEADVAVVIADRVSRDDDLGSLRELIRVVVAHFKILALPDLLASDVFERANQKIAIFEDDFVESHVLAHCCLHLLMNRQFTSRAHARLASSR